MMKITPEGYSKISEAAESGDPFAEVMLGYLLQHGFGETSKEQESSRLWYQRAAKRGFAPGQYLLSLVLYNEDPEEAIQQLTAAAEVGYSPAQFFLGTCYLFGDGVGQDESMAIDLLKKAAHQDYLPALTELSLVYQGLEDGTSVSVDIDAAIFYSRRGAELGSLVAATSYGMLALKHKSERDGPEEGIKWLKKAADQRDRTACGYLSTIYQGGFYGIKKSTRLAKHYLEAMEACN